VKKGFGISPKILMKRKINPFSQDKIFKVEMKVEVE